MPNLIEILNDHGGSMELGELIAYALRVGIDYSSLLSVLAKLKKEGHIKISGNTIILVPTYEAVQMLKPGIENEDKSITPTGHKQLSIPYDQTLFRVLGRSGKLLKKVTVDEGIADLLIAIWKHRIHTTRSCQGGDGEKAWIRFQWREDVVLFNELVGHISRISGKKEWNLNETSLEISFPPEHIAMMTEELNRKPID